MDHSDLAPDPVWTERYECEAEKIRGMSDPIGVFHVGSTAIPGVPGKPALDIIAVYPDAETMDAATEALVADGYRTEGGDDSCTVLRREIDAGLAIVKLHLPDDERVHNQLVFRDFLRANERAREEYTAVKRKAAAEHPDDLGAYTKHKTEVVHDLLDRARDEGYDEDLPDAI